MVADQSPKKRELQRQMRSLSRRSRSVEEVRQRLAERELPSDIIEEILTELIEHGFLDDRRYAGEYVRTKLRAGFGPHRIRRELNERNVNSSYVEEVLEEEKEDFPEVKIMREALAARLRTRGEPKSPRELKNLVDFLIRRGFSRDLVRAELDRYYGRIFS